MRLFNYRFSQKNGITSYSWTPKFLLSYKKQKKSFIEWKIYIDFAQHHPECFGDCNRFMVRVGNYQLTFHFDFINCEYE